MRASQKHFKGCMAFVTVYKLEIHMGRSESHMLQTIIYNISFIELNSPGE